MSLFGFEEEAAPAARFDTKPFAAFLANRPAAGYRCILADPPWQYEFHSEAGEGKAPQAHYACHPVERLAALPVGQLAAADAALVMWVVGPMLPVALDLMAAWGFKYKTWGAWAKRTATGQRWAFGTGYIYRGAAEGWLLGTVGAPKILNHATRNLIADAGLLDGPARPIGALAEDVLGDLLIVDRLREHSRKPDAMHATLEQLFASPRCELFAREERPGWHCWGNEAGKFSARRGAA